jgi:phosphoglycerol transferase MdoB-like AlkP superfamily enzyme
MEETSVRVKRLLLQILFLLFFCLLCRLLFIYVNKAELEVSSIESILPVLGGGLRFDLSAIILTNSLFIIMTLAPSPVSTNKHYQKITAVLFLFINSLCLLANMIDVAYFSFVHKRSQSDALLFITGEKGYDLLRLLPSFLMQYWYLLLTYCLFTWLLWKTYKFTLKSRGNISRSLKDYLYSSLAFLIIIVISVIAIRGGFQAKPLDIIHASEMTEVKNIPAILNTPFTIIKSLGKENLHDKKYFPEEQLKSFSNGIHTAFPQQPFTRQNVVIIIIESLSRKHTGYFGGEAHTPFLDSLFAQSLVFTNAFANAKESIQGIPAIISSIPSWQAEPFIFSPYASNKITSLASILKSQGYQTSFFHGGFNGTMGFDSYSSLAEFDNYYGTNEYDNDRDYDGNWGIWDEPFLQFMAQQLSATKQPFFSTVFTLNTHHPFNVPDQYEKIFCRHKEKLLNCIEYLDLSLLRFFDAIKTQAWFSNTIFVITADHTAPNTEDNKLSSPMEDYRIPIVFYTPGNTFLKGTSSIIANQIDILPSILSLLNYPYPYYSMGTSLFTANSKRYSINYNGNIYQYIDSASCYQFNGENPVAFYNWRSDSLLSDNLYHGQMNKDMLYCDSSLKMQLQFFFHSMMNNKMNIETAQTRK